MDELNKTTDTAKTEQTKNKSQIVFIIVLVLVAAAGVLGCLHQQSRIRALQTTQKNYETLASTPNQACIGLDKAAAHGLAIVPKKLSVSSSLYKNDSDGKEAVNACKIGTFTEAASIQGKYVDKYEMGAEVTYFKDSSSAEAYAKKNLYPLRYWSTEPQGSNVPQTGIFVFIVTNNSPNYFDAYSVKGSALVRVTLPCTVAGASDSSCIKDGERMIDSVGYFTVKEFAQSVAQLQFE